MRELAIWVTNEQSDNPIGKVDTGDLQLELIYN